MLFCFAAFDVVAQAPFVSQKLDLNSGLNRNTVSVISEDFDGRILIGTPAGLQSYNGSELADIEEITSGVYDLLYAPDSLRYYVITYNGIHAFNKYAPTHVFLPYDQPGFYKFSQWNSDALVIASGDLTYQVDPDLEYISLSALKTKKTSPIGLDEASLPQGFQLKLDHNMWIEMGPLGNWFATFDGIVQWDPSSTEEPQRFWEGKRFESLYRDQRGNVWIGTVSDGLWLIHANTLETEFISTRQNGINYPGWMIFESEFGTLSATSNGIIDLDSNTDLPIESATRGMHCLSALEVDGTVFIGTAQDGIFLFADGQLSPAFFDPEEPLNNTTIQFIQTQNRVVAATKWGTVRFNLKGELISNETYRSLGMKGYFMHVESNEDGFLAATTTGAAQLDADILQAQYLDEENTVVLSSFAYHNDTLWFASVQKGLLYLADSVLQPHPFPSKSLLSVKSINDSTLVILSSTAVYLRTPNTLRKIDSHDGIAIREFAQGGLYCSEGSKIMVSGVEGIAAFDIALFSKPSTPPRFEFEALNARYVETEHIELGAGEKRLNLLLEPIYPPNDNAWQFEIAVDDSLEQIERSSIHAFPIKDESVVKMRVSSAFDAASRSENQVLTISVPSPFYLRPWFILALLAFLVMMGMTIRFAIQQRRQKLLIQQAEEEQKINDERLRISRELHDNIGSRLTHIISSLDIEMYKNKGKESQLPPINQFARETMSQLRETIWAVSDRSIHFSEFTHRIEHYIDQVESGYPGELSFSSNVASDYQLSPVETINYFRIVQEAINNGMKYASPQKVEVTFLQNQNDIQLHVSNPGAEINEDDFQKGSGLKGMRARAKECGANFEAKRSGDMNTISLSFHLPK